jgi:hypothetical protein
MRIRIALVAASVAVSIIIITIPAVTARSATAAVAGTRTPVAKGNVPATDAERAVRRTTEDPRSRPPVHGPTPGTAAVTAVGAGTLARVASSSDPEAVVLPFTLGPRIATALTAAGVLPTTAPAQGGLAATAPAPPPPPTDATSVATADWQCIRVHESGDRYNSVAAPSGAYGIIQVTWHSFGQPGWPYEAPAAVQDALALRLYSLYGWHPWGSRWACGL